MIEKAELRMVLFLFSALVAIFFTLCFSLYFRFLLSLPSFADCSLFCPKLSSLVTEPESSGLCDSEGDHHDGWPQETFSVFWKAK